MPPTVQLTPLARAIRRRVIMDLQRRNQQVADTSSQQTLQQISTPEGVLLPTALPPVDDLLGDVVGPASATVVERVRGQPFADVGASIGDAWIWDGSAWVPGPIGRSDQVRVLLYNFSGVDMVQGEVVTLDPADNGRMAKVATAAFVAGMVGVTTQDVANGSAGYVCISGLVDQVLLTASGALGQFIKASETAGRATAFTPIGIGAFGQITAGAGTSPQAMIWNPPRWS